MLAEQFVKAADGARTPAVLDELARKLWRAHAERQIEDADAETISEAVEARRAALAGKVTQIGPKAVLGLPRASRRRDKMFGLGRPGTASRVGLPPQGRRRGLWASCAHPCGLPVACPLFHDNQRRVGGREGGLRASVQ